MLGFAAWVFGSAVLAFVNGTAPDPAMMGAIGALALAGLGAAAGSLIIGRLIDGGRGTHSLALAYGLGAAVLVLKALAWASPLHALIATALGALAAPMLALPAEPDALRTPAQFVFDRGQLTPHDAAAQGVLAFVVSASEGERDALQARVLQQAADQLGLIGLQAIQTVVEKRATFACTPDLRRPAAAIAPGLWAAGDYVEGPYPATLEGAVRSGLAAGQAV
mgnify:CR=1 FL=1